MNWRTITGCLVLAAICGTGLPVHAAKKEPVKGKRSHQEVGTLCDTGKTKTRSIESFCLDAENNLLVCDGQAKVIKVVSPENELLAQWKVGMNCSAIACDAEGNVYAAGGERVVKLDAEGKIVADVSLAQPQPEAKAKKPKKSRNLLEALFDVETEAAAPVRRSSVVGMAISTDAVYVSKRGATGYDVVRLDKDLSKPEPIVSRLRGCCGQMDISACGDKLIVAENSRHQVNVYDRDGKLASHFGESDREKLQAFGGCCNPMNLSIVGNRVYTAESVSPEALVKSYSLDGKFEELVGSAKGPSSCARVTIAVSSDEKTVYILDGSGKTDLIRKLVRTDS